MGVRPLRSEGRKGEGETRGQRRAAMLPSRAGKDTLLFIMLLSERLEYLMMF